MKELYLLLDGTHADPSECDLGADHELRHSNGVPVSLRADGTPETITVDMAPEPKPRPAPKATYKTRERKAR